MKNEPRLFAACLLLLAMTGNAFAQGAADAYPAKPVTLIVPFAAGGTITTIEARLYAQKLSEQFGGKSVLVDFKAGAGGAIGAVYVAKSAPDGYTLLVASGAFILVPVLSRNPPYDPVKDFSPVAHMTNRTNLMAVNPSLPVKSIREYVAYARANPGKINFATSGSGSGPHLGGAWLHKASGTTATFIHYKGTAALLGDMMSGRVNATIGSYAALAPLVSSGKLRLLAVTGDERIELLPDVPTIAEQGVTGYNYSNWLGIVAPAKTPAAIVARLAGEFGRVARNPEASKLLAAENSQSITNSTPEKFRALIVSETARWSELIREAGIEAEE